MTQLASLAPGSSLVVAGATQVPAPAAKGENEADAEYLERLSGADGDVFPVKASASFAGGLKADPATAVIARRLPVVNVDKRGPAEFSPGTLSTYEIEATNTGSAAALVDASDQIDGQPKVGLMAFAALGTQESATGVTSWVVPSSFPGSSLHDRASVTWSDRVGNAYGPVTADFTSLKAGVEDLPPPTMQTGPQAASPTGLATFAFDGLGGARFECRIDDSAWAECSSPHTAAGLATGPHHFEVRQLMGATLSEPASYNWAIDLDAQVCRAEVVEPEIWRDQADMAGVSE